MRINTGSLIFNVETKSDGGTPDWGTSLGQSKNNGYKYKPESHRLLIGMLHNKIEDIENVSCPLGKGGNGQERYDPVLAAVFEKVFINGKLVEDSRFVLLVVKEVKGHHAGRETLKYNPKISYNGETPNEEFFKKAAGVLGVPEDAAWFVGDIEVRDQDELHFRAFVLDENGPTTYPTKNDLNEACDKMRHRNPALSGYNKIYYGAPGCGKSFFLKSVILPEDRVAKSERFRTTFHPEYTNTDFVGQILPIVTGEKVTYKFSPGPFALALKRCYETDKMVYLVIEEINRGNAPAIFGDLFQLLDRCTTTTEEKACGESEYDITNVGLQDYLTRELGDVFESIVIPSNLTILATMNTSDQNVFTLDTAFKRRWLFEQISNDIDADKGHPFKDWYLPGSPLTWATFIKKINAVILRYKGVNSTHEDKRLGKYFVTQNCLTEQSLDISKCQDQARDFAYKVLEYLWDDVFKYDRDTLFDIGTYPTLESLIAGYMKKTTDIFKNGILDEESA